MNAPPVPPQHRGPQRHTEPPRTGSLRRRVVVSTVAVLALALVLGSVLVAVLFQSRSNREETELLRERVDTAVSLDQQGVAPRVIARRISGGGAIAKVSIPGGGTVGPAAFWQPRTADTPRRTARLADGARVTVFSTSAGSPVLTARLRRVLFGVGIGTVVLTALVLLATVRVALRPLERMTALAHRIVTGSRGQRLGPRHPDTELGRTTAVFDEMLDALEGAEARARASEARTRAFVADAAHELRTPVAGVRAAAEALVHAPGDEQARQRLAVLAVREANRAAVLVENLLSLAKIDAGLDLRDDDVDLLALARSEVDRTALLAPQLRCTVDGQPARVRGDADRLAQVLTNLLDNARRHTPDGGTVAVRVSTGPAGVELAVTDSGPGVPADARERIFDRLVRLDDSTQGHSGLGLPIARGIAHAHGGELRCVSPATGAGACFVLTLPAVPAGEPLSRSGPGPRGSG